MARTLTWDFVFLTLLLSGLAYLAVDALWVEGGFSEESDLMRRRSALQAEIGALEGKLDKLQARTDALGGGEIDRDLFDERARARFGSGRPDEVLLQEQDGGLR